MSDNNIRPAESATIPVVPTRGSTFRMGGALITAAPRAGAAPALTSRTAITAAITRRNRILTPKGPLAIC